MRLNGWQLLGIALMAVGLIGGTVLGAVTGIPEINAGCITSVPEHYANTLIVRLSSYENPAGQVIVATFDTGTVSLTLDEFGNARHGFDSGTVGVHIINLYWSDGVLSDDCVISYYVVAGDPTPVPPNEEESSGWPIMYIVAGFGAVLAAVGTFAKRNGSA